MSTFTLLIPVLEKHENVIIDISMVNQTMNVIYLDCLDFEHVLGSTITRIRTVCLCFPHIVQ